VELLDGPLCLLLGRHLHEAEPPRAARGTVGHHRGGLAGAGLREQLAQLLARGVERKIPYEQPSPHRLSSASCRSLLPTEVAGTRWTGRGLTTAATKPAGGSRGGRHFAGM